MNILDTLNKIKLTNPTLSGGEAPKVQFCKILNKPTNILILDEPTNHLDSSAKTELIKALN
ncbi:MAG: ATP-binding cassette domain-containing protein [Clostridium sp.]|nr:ATP-binding cassette domain-containing protein [Clostridium sp.]